MTVVCTTYPDVSLFVTISPTGIVEVVVDGGGGGGEEEEVVDVGVDVGVRASYFQWQCPQSAFQQCHHDRRHFRSLATTLVVHS